MKTLLTATMLLLLTACSSTPPQPLDRLPASANQALQQWQITGKLGLRGEDIAESAYLNWRQCQQDFDIRLSGPLGSRALQLSGNPQQAQLITADQQQYNAAGPEQLLYQQLGWHFPVTDLLYWLRGLPAPDSRSTTTDQGFQQNGWQISYLRFIDTAQHRLPGKLIAQHPQLKVTLIIKDWQLSPNCP